MDRSKYFLSVVLYLRDVYVLVLYGCTNECARTTTLLLPLSGVSRGAVSVTKIEINENAEIQITYI